MRSETVYERTNNQHFVGVAGSRDEELRNSTVCARALYRTEQQTRKAHSNTAAKYRKSVQKAVKTPTEYRANVGSKELLPERQRVYFECVRG